MNSTKVRLAELGEGEAAIAHNSLFTVIPVNYPPQSAIRWKDTLLYEAEKTLSDKDIKVLLAVLKAYSDGRYEALQKNKGKVQEHVSETSVASIRVNVREISDAAFNNQRERPGWIKDALEKISALKLHLLDDKLRSRGFIRIVSGAALSPNRKEIEVGINKSFLIDMMSNLAAYHFGTAIKHVVKTKKGLRRLTPVELERLNMFPDNHTNKMDCTAAKRAFFMGNALVVGIVEGLGNSLKKAISG